MSEPQPFTDEELAQIRETIIFGLKYTEKDFVSVKDYRAFMNQQRWLATVDALKEDISYLETSLESEDI